jgi:hypothetical protein
VPQIPAALSWCDAQGRLSGHHPAQAHLDEASQQRPGECWNKVKRLVRDARTLRPVERRQAPLTAAVSDPVWRDALTRLWYVNDQRQQAPGDADRRLRQRVVMEHMRCECWCPQGQSASRRVDESWRPAVRARSAVEGVHRVVRMPQGRHRQVSQGLLDLKRLYWHWRDFREGKRTGKSPYDLLGVHLPSADWWQLLQMAPEE